jgi:hypothetical protein
MTANNPSATTPTATARGEIADADLAKVTGGGGKTKTTPLLEIDGIKGESKDDKHPGTIEIS